MGMVLIQVMGRYHFDGASVENSYLARRRATNLECADSGGALDILEFSWAANPKRRRATLAAALQISFSTQLDRLKIRIKGEIGGAEQACVVTTFSRHHFNFCSRHGKSTFGDLALHVFRKQFPRIHHSAANHNHFGIE